MEFINNIKNETLIICSNNDKINILKRNRLINIKVMNFQEFILKYCFDYDEDAIIYIMEEYNVKYEIATMYLKNLYFIEEKDYGIKKKKDL